MEQRTLLWKALGWPTPHLPAISVDSVYQKQNPRWGLVLKMGSQEKVE
jgi:hypothetical protein